MNCIEEMISKANKQLDDERLLAQALQDKKLKNQHRSNLRSRLDALRLEAESAEKKWIMMKRISVGDLFEANQQRTSLSYTGTCSESCATISFFSNNTGDLVCESSRRHSFDNNAYGSQIAALFWQAHNEVLCAAMTVSSKPKVSILRRLLRSNACTRCRLEAICYELKMLHRRYGATLEAIHGQNGFKSFMIHVRFSRYGSQLVLLSSFEINNAYPFGSLNAQMKLVNGAESSTSHKTRLDTFQEVIAKNARPGFGYLSRTVAVLSAYFDQELAKNGVTRR